MEVAKLRAARLLWAKLVKQFDPKSAKSLSLRTHCQTSGWSLTAQDVFNNVTRTCVEAMAATQGHTQSLHTNALDEALALPTDFSARIARNTQLVLQQESGTTRVIDPWGGSAYVEKLTYDLARRAWSHIQEVEQAGGMAKAIDAGLPKLRIEEAAARTQARIDSGRQPVIGVNKYRPADDDALDIRRVDNTAVRAEQAEKLRRLRTERDQPATDAALAALTNAAAAASGGPPASGGGLEQNLLALAIDAARAKATVGEISDALEQVYGRHAATIRTISGVYREEAGQVSAIDETRGQHIPALTPGSPQMSAASDGGGVKAGMCWPGNGVRSRGRSRSSSRAARRGQGLADLTAESGQHVEDIRRAELLANAGEFQHRQRRCLCRLEDHGVAGDEGGGDLDTRRRSVSARASGFGSRCRSRGT
jgi:Methylmalonyl-CoA mutase